MPVHIKNENVKIISSGLHVCIYQNVHCAYSRWTHTKNDKCNFQGTICKLI